MVKTGDIFHYEMSFEKDGKRFRQDVVSSKSIDDAILAAEKLAEKGITKVILYDVGSDRYDYLNMYKKGKISMFL